MIGATVSPVHSTYAPHRPTTQMPTAQSVAPQVSPIAGQRSSFQMGQPLARLAPPALVALMAGCTGTVEPGPALVGAVGGLAAGAFGTLFSSIIAVATGIRSANANGQIQEPNHYNMHYYPSMFSPRIFLHGNEYTRLYKISNWLGVTATALATAIFAGQGYSGETVLPIAALGLLGTTVLPSMLIHGVDMFRRPAA